MLQMGLCKNNDGGNMRLKDLREDNDLLQKDVAKILNIAERTYSGYETESPKYHSPPLLNSKSYIY